MSKQIRKVIVAGGTGFIGLPLCRALHAAGCQVTALSRGPDRPEASSPWAPALRRWDGASGAGWEDLADGAFALVNLAGENIAAARYTQAKKRSILESRLSAGRAMVDAVRRAAVKPAALIQASAVGYYGDTGPAPVDETAPAGRGFLAEVATAWEESTRQVQDMGVRRAVVRTGLVLGRGGGILARMAPAFRWFAGGPLGSGKQGFSWVHLDDEVAAIRFLIEHPTASGPFNITAPHPVTNRELCQALGKALRRPCGLAAPAFALRLLFGEMADELFLSGCLALPVRLQQLGFAFTYPRLEQALAHLLGPEAR